MPGESNNILATFAVAAVGAIVGAAALSYLQGPPSTKQLVDQVASAVESKVSKKVSDEVNRQAASMQVAVAPSSKVYPPVQTPAKQVSEILFPIFSFHQILHVFVLYASTYA
jgi:hypothetical protein